MAKLIICVDGLGKDLISKAHTPFLYSFGSKNYFSELETLFATTGIEYCFFTGKYPSETGIWLEFVKKENSIFKNKLLHLFYFRKVKDYVAALIQILKKRTWISGVHNIPLEKVKYFEPKVKNNVWKLKYFQKRDFSFYKWPFFVTKNRDKEKIRIIFNYENDESRLKRILGEKNKEIYYTQLMKIDKTLHKFGKKDKRTAEELRKMDSLLKKTIFKFRKKFPKGDIFLWSDHGFADIKKNIDIMSALPMKDDYLFFIAGTTAHFWFKNEKRKRELIGVLSKFKELKLLNKKDKIRYNIPFGEEYGDIIYFLEKGNYFFPNFYQKENKEKFVGMHDYPKDRELNGFLISTKQIPQKIKMREVLNFI